MSAAVAKPDHVPPDRLVDIDIYDLPGQREDFHRAWHALQQASPSLVWTPRNEGHWIALSGQLIAEAQSNHQRFSSKVIVIPKSVGEMHGLIPTTIDPPAHGPYRRLLNAAMSPARVRGLHGSIRAVAAELIEVHLATGRMDFTTDYARIFPIRIFMALVGLPMEDADHIRHLAECMTRPDPPMPFDQAREALFAYVRPTLTARRQRGGEDLISQIVHADVGGRQLDETESLLLATQVLIAGVDTVVNMLGFCMAHLARDASTRAALAGGSWPQMLLATNELFRRYGLVTIGRMVRDDTELDGCLLKAGEMICLPTQLHGLDEQINTDALSVQLSRRQGRHSTFGSGPHMCPGQELARAEVAITIDEWIRRIPDFSIDPESDLRCSGGIVGQLDRLVLRWAARG